MDNIKLLPFLRAWAESEKQSPSFWIRTLVTDTIFYTNKLFAMCVCVCVYTYMYLWKSLSLSLSLFLFLSLSLSLYSFYQLPSQLGV